MLRTILIVDDSEINRRLLFKALHDEYEILEAGDGLQAMEIVARESKRLSAVLLDLLMPNMDGYEVLRNMRENAEYAQIPVLVTTGNTEDSAEVRALSLGANDFVTKPYNPIVIRHRLRNTINLRETAGAVNAMKRDRLTGLFNREAFFDQAGDMLKAKEPGYYIMACLDIDHFAVVNDQYGTEKGDLLLRRIADILREGFEPAGGVCCRVASDNFAVLYPESFCHTQQIEEIREKLSVPESSMRRITYSIGRCRANDIALSASAIYDRAVMAQESIMDRYDTHVAEYAESMRDELLKQQEIVNQMTTALANGEFEVWYQPQFNHSTGALIGSEALVRWRHPVKGLIPPNDFIPVFERNGFIYELDKFVWERVCMFLRKRLDQGEAPLPVAVNISRYDVFRQDFCEVLMDIVRRHRIEPALLHVEITESAFTELPEQIIDVVKRLIDDGFTVEIDDFGSGYSSLNTLKDVPASILKLDMRFLTSSENSERGGNILEAIVRMATWLGMPVIAEGVETKEQADYLRSIGCHYVQGYLYARPMPESDFENLVTGAAKEMKPTGLETRKSIGSETFWDPSSMQTLLFNSFAGGAGIFEYRAGKVELLRVNDKYVAELCGEGVTMQEAMAIRPEEHMDAENRALMLDNILRAIDSPNESRCELRLQNLPGQTGDVYLRVSLCMISRAADRVLLYCSIMNITALRSAEQRARDMRQELMQMMNDTPGGYVRLRILPDGRMDSLFVNEGFCRILGIRREDVVLNEQNRLLENTHPDDVARVYKSLQRMIKTGETGSIRYRMYNGRGRYVWLAGFGRVTENAAGERYLNIYYSTLSGGEAQENAVRDVLPAALAAMMRYTSALAFVKDKDLRYICCSTPFAKLAGLNTEAEVVGKTDDELVDTELAEKYRESDQALLESGKPMINFLARLPSKDGEARYANTSKFPLYDMEGNIIGIYGAGRDVTEERAAYARLKLLTESIPGGLATYACAPDGIRILYFNDGFCNILGYSREEYIRHAEHSVTSKIFSEDVHIVMEQIAALRKDNTPIDCVYRVHTKGGGYKWINLRGIPAERNKNTVIVHAVQYDVTELREAQERLRVSEQEMRVALSLMGKMVLLYDVATRSLTLPAPYAEKHGLPEYMTNVPASILERGHVAAQDSALFERFFKAIHRGDSHCIGEAHVLCADGSSVWERAEAVTVFSSDGKPVKAIISIEDVTTLHSAQAETEHVRQNAEVMRLVVQHSARVIYRYDVNTREAVSAEPLASAAMGLPDYVESMPDSLIEQGIIVQEDADYVRKLFHEARQHPRSDSMRFRIRNNKGAVRWLDVKYTFIRTGAEPTAAIISCLDITDQHERELAFERCRQTAREGAAENGMYLEIDLSANLVEKVGGELLPASFDPTSQPHGVTVDRLTRTYLSLQDQEEARRCYSREDLMTAFADGQREMERDWLTHFSDGSEHWLHIALQMVSDPYTGHVKTYLLIKDVTEEKTARIEIERRAEHDGMTGLLNRATAEKEISKALMSGDADNAAMLILDLDDLKGINDRFGHAEGDKAIKAVAAAIRSAFRKTDIVGRAGGDEFIVLLRDAPNAAHVSVMIESLLHRIQEESVGEAGRRTLSVSVGVAYARMRRDSFEELFMRADTALYHIKRSDKNNYAFFAPEMQTPNYRYEGEKKITLRKEAMFSKTELERLLAAISSFYTLVMSANLMRNSYYLMEYKVFHTCALRESGTIDEALAGIADSLYPDDRMDFLARFSREALLTAFDSGEPNICYTCRQKCADGFRNIEIILVFYCEDGGDACAFSFVRSADGENKIKEN